jgi:hypothetical protein
MVMVSGIPGPVALPQSSAQRFNLALINILLAFENFQHLEHFFHIVERSSQGIDNRVYFLDSFLDRSLRGRR